MREELEKFVLEKEGVSLKEGEHIPRVSHEQGKIVPKM